MEEYQRWMTTTGGGMLISNDEETIKKAKFWSTQSKEPKRYYQHEEIGYNYRMSNVLAGIGRGQMKVLEQRIAKKREIFDMYKRAFEDIDDIEMIEDREYERSNRWLSTMTIKEESKVKPLNVVEALEKENIEARLVWKPMHMQPIFRNYDFIKVDDKVVSEDLFERGVCLPSDTKMTEEQQTRIIEIIKNLFE